MGNYFKKSDYPKIKLETFGDWDKSIRVMQKLSPEIKACSLKAQLKVCEIIAKRVKRHLTMNDLGWRPLDETYQKKRNSAGLHGVILYAHGVYYNSINVWVPGNKNMVMVGVKSGIYTRTLNGKPSKLEVSKIAAIHEFSRKYKRPLWNPTLTELGGKKFVKATYINSLIWHLRKNGIPITVLKKL